MTEEQIALAKRVVACKGWRWMPGMRYRLHPTHPWFRYDGEDCSDDDGNPIPQATPNLQSKAALPDLTDPATLGCLLALVREAHGSPKITFEGQTYASVLYVVCGSGNYYIRRDCGDGEEALYVDGVWSANVRHGVDEVSCDTEAEALVAALEAAQ